MRRRFQQVNRRELEYVNRALTVVGGRSVAAAFLLWITPQHLRNLVNYHPELAQWRKPLGHPGNESKLGFPLGYFGEAACYTLDGIKTAIAGLGEQDQAQLREWLRVGMPACPEDLAVLRVLSPAQKRRALEAWRTEHGMAPGDTGKGQEGQELTGLLALTGERGREEGIPEAREARCEEGTQKRSDERVRGAQEPGQREGDFRAAADVVRGMRCAVAPTGGAERPTRAEGAAGSGEDSGSPV